MNTQLSKFIYLFKTNKKLANLIETNRSKYNNDGENFQDLDNISDFETNDYKQHQQLNNNKSKFINNNNNEDYQEKLCYSNLNNTGENNNINNNNRLIKSSTITTAKISENESKINKIKSISNNKKLTKSDKLILGNNSTKSIEQEGTSLINLKTKAVSYNSDLVEIFKDMATFEWPNLVEDQVKINNNTNAVNLEKSTGTTTVITKQLKFEDNLNDNKNCKKSIETSTSVSNISNKLSKLSTKKDRVVLTTTSFSTSNINQHDKELFKNGSPPPPPLPTNPPPDDDELDQTKQLTSIITNNTKSKSRKALKTKHREQSGECPHHQHHRFRSYSRGNKNNPDRSHRSGYLTGPFASKAHSCCSSRSSSVKIVNILGKEIIKLPNFLEREIKVRKNFQPLGISSVDCQIDEGINGCTILKIDPNTACAKDNNLKVGDYLLSVNNEQMRNLTNSSAKAILNRASLTCTDVV